MMPYSITLSSLTTFDWFLVVVILVSTLAAFRRGLIKVLFSLAGVTAGILLASWNYHHVAEYLHRVIASSATANILAFVLILIAVTTLFTLAARLVQRTVSAIGLGFLDRLLGAVFGLARGLLLGVAALMLAAAFAPSSPWFSNSQLAPAFLSGAHAVSYVIPAHLQQKIASGATFLLHQGPVIFKSHTPANSM
jgi:membrane protein required for colicin V production